MARNLAQLVILLFCLWMLFRSYRVIRSLLLIRLDKRELDKRTRGVVNKFTLIRVKKYLPPLIFWLNAASVAVFALVAVFQLTLGWFNASFIVALSKINITLTVLLCSGEAYFLSLMDSVLRFDKPFILYNWDPDGDKIFSSGILDLLLCVAAPLAIVVADLFL